MLEEAVAGVGRAPGGPAPARAPSCFLTSGQVDLDSGMKACSPGRVATSM